MHPLQILDRCFDRLSRGKILALAVGAVAIVGGLDYLAGYEVSLSLLYLGPVAIAAWYADRSSGIAVALLSCLSWYIADVVAGHPYSSPAIPVWNALVRLGFFLTTGLLVSTLRKNLLSQRHLARTDGLTELYGRRAFEDRLRHDLALAKRRGSTLSLAYVDLDNFKSVNDSRGHAEGDRVLRAVARVLRHTVRKADTAARIGGDEFALVLLDTDRRGAEEVISKLRDELQEARGTTAWPVTCSIGVTTFMDPAISPESAVAAADASMYEAKRSGKGAVVYSVLGGAVQRRAEHSRRSRRAAERAR